LTSDVTQHVADTGAFHLDDVRALISQHRRRPRPGDQRANIDHADSLERPGHGVSSYEYKHQKQ